MDYDHSFFSEKSIRVEPPSISWLMRLALDRPELISLAAGFTDNATLPLDSVKEIADRILSDPKRGQAALQYGTTLGSAELRRATADRLHRLDKDQAVSSNPDPSKTAHTHALNPDQILITQGSQQALYLTLEAITDPGDIMLVEDPTYFVFLGLLQGFGIQTHGIATDTSGIQPWKLEEKLLALEKSGELKRLKALYLVSYAQNPSGRSTTYERKKEALEILKRFESSAGHPIALIEDAAYRELEFDQEQSAPSLLTEPNDRERVFYLGTYTKPFATGMRVGFGHFPALVLDKIFNLKGLNDFGAAKFTQSIVSEAIASGIYDTHTQLLRQRYFEKASAMDEAMKEHAPENLSWEFPSGGLYIWAKLGGGATTGPESELFKRCLEEGILYIPGVYAYCSDLDRTKPDVEMRLSYGAADIPVLQSGIKRLCEAISGLESRSEH